MPRQARLDVPGLLHHVMARGIERRKIFKDGKDRKAFLERLAIILEETQTQCYAWSLLPNHFHLLLRTGLTPLSKVMRRLMTGYAITFNRRHKRSGHLFQNRYKSVVCEQDLYLLELIRYIHLNPLRAGIVKDLKELDKYPWTGHIVIIGRRKNPLIPEVQERESFSAARRIAISQFRAGIEKAKANPKHPVNPVEIKSLAEKTIEDVLLHFGNSLSTARRRYRQFVKNGIDQGTRPDLQGGGWIRSAGGDKRGLLGSKKEEREKGDERILGSGEFINEILRKAEQKFKNNPKKKMSLEEIISVVAQAMDVSVEDLLSGSRKRRIAHARAIVVYAAVRTLRYKGTELAEVLSLSPPTISQNIDKGRFFLDRNDNLKVKLAIN